MGAVGAEDDDVDGVVVRGAVERVVEGVEEAGILGVSDFRTVEGRCERLGVRGFRRVWGWIRAWD